MEKLSVSRTASGARSLMDISPPRIEHELMLRIASQILSTHDRPKENGQKWTSCLNLDIERLKTQESGNILLACANVVPLLHRQDKDSAVPDLACPGRFSDDLQHLIYQIVR